MVLHSLWSAANAVSNHGKCAMTPPMAKRFLNVCPTCNGNVGFGHLYVQRNGTAYHTQCVPDKSPPSCWCGGELGETETEHQECFEDRTLVTYFTRAMAGVFSPPYHQRPVFRAFK